ncbi:lipoate--protein ligase family protein [Neobacillus notoginsengisoli]|uniref:Octanoyl-[GcvH]:protein N-octanoyltransferase n=1 Tax=Neobacillus notoginsengisoli TaxID=1578198 RepID=A0A417YT93_9BACI|nr:lipoate--protein ligase family protein [Neobacillus notoginsengisoli]RHW40243.1 lipoate--protein ligase family protein [Neobacillus notoginsengisoli]
MRNEALTLLRQDQWRLIDQSTTGILMPAIESFAIDDTLCASVGSHLAPATARTWVHRDTVVLGIQDTRVPNLNEGVEFLRSRGYEVIVRNSGGLAVALDEGVLNISLILPEIEKGIDINRGYDAMWMLIQHMFADFGKTIEAREIVGSYCPGSYDLSIGGKKFAGISQRRLRKGVAVQIYLSVIENSVGARAELVRDFYLRALKGEKTKIAYPEVRPEVMASLSELLGTPLTVQDVMLRLLRQLKDNSSLLYSGQLTPHELDLFPSYYARILDRNAELTKP